mmetsp:Transcript_18402/g.40665  ORF Transcript_18402/g.40665 Transcript_18402/m.40665 type:complete len:174 (-) Transcript_18402:36-557(-)
MDPVKQLAAMEKQIEKEFWTMVEHPQRPPRRANSATSSSDGMARRRRVAIEEPDRSPGGSQAGHAHTPSGQRARRPQPVLSAADVSKPGFLDMLATKCEQVKRKRHTAEAVLAPQKPLPARLPLHDLRPRSRSSGRQSVRSRSTSGLAPFGGIEDARSYSRPLSALSQSLTGF